MFFEGYFLRVFLKDIGFDDGKCLVFIIEFEVMSFFFIIKINSEWFF